MSIRPKIGFDINVYGSDLHEMSNSIGLKIITPE